MKGASHCLSHGLEDGNASMIVRSLPGIPRGSHLAPDPNSGSTGSALAVGDALAARGHGVDYEWFVDESVVTHSPDSAALLHCHRVGRHVLLAKQARAVLGATAAQGSDERLRHAD